MDNDNADNYESRELDNICSICNTADTRPGLNSCLKCYVESEHRILETEHNRNIVFGITPFKRIIEPITSNLDDAIKRIESYKPYDVKLTPLGLIGYVRV